jgi:hypothetical protein
MLPDRILVDELTPVQRSAIVNGCGAKGRALAWLRPPQLCYAPACDQHDVDYWQGGGWAAKHRADRALWVATLDALGRWLDDDLHTEPLTPPDGTAVLLRVATAIAIHAAVVAGGFLAFHWTHRPRTRADLEDPRQLAG